MITLLILFLLIAGLLAIFMSSVGVVIGIIVIVGLIIYYIYKKHSGNNES